MVDANEEKNSTLFLVAKLIYILGMDELERSIWLLSILMNREKNRSMPEFTKVNCQTSNSHKDLSLCRIQTDHQNAQKIFKCLAERYPFHIDTVRINLISDEVANEPANVFQAKAIGEPLIQGITGTCAFDYKFRKKDMVIIIKTNVSVNIEDSVVEVDPPLFSQ